MDYCLDYLWPESVPGFRRENLACHLSEKKLEIRHYDDALVLPGCIQGGGVVIKGEYEPQSHIHYGHSRAHAYPVNRSDLRYEEEAVCYLGMFSSVWGHCITDNIRRLWFFDNQPSIDISGLKFIYVTEKADDVFPDSFLELINKLGLSMDRFTRITAPTVCRSLYLPDSCFYLDPELHRRVYTKEYIDIIDRICATADSEKIARYANTKVYLSRTSFENNRDFGETAVEQAFAEAGYSIICPEKLPFDEQLCLYRSAGEIATTEGSISHNAIFMKKGSRLVIVRKTDYLNEEGYQFAVNYLKGPEVIYIDAHLSCMLTRKAHPWAGPFFIFPGKNLTRYLHRKPLGFPVFEFVRYLVNGVYRKILYTFFHTEIKRDGSLSSVK